MKQFCVFQKKFPNKIQCKKKVEISTEIKKLRSYKKVLAIEKNFPSPRNIKIVDF